MPKNSGAEEAKRESEKKKIACLHAVRNSCLKGNSDRRKSALPETDKIYVCIHSKCEKKTRNAFYKMHEVRNSCFKMKLIAARVRQ